ncbi:MAG: hypothetical protein QG567_2324 [Campylobacterota bacterium]|nr:hypothetical protein [Campylobacterota bacterium]
MAERRMMSKKIIHSDAFLDMPSSTQNLYFHLLLEADDEGFVNSHKRVQRTVGAGDDDVKILLAKKFIIGFESGVVVIKHWRIHNYIQNDRFKSSTHTKERSKLVINDNSAYALNDVYILDTNCTPSIGKDRIGEVSIVENIYSDVISHLNQTLGKAYKPTTESTVKLIKARLKDGFTLEDFKKVHIVKYSEWNNTDMQKFLRPETLYGTKFESYLNQKLTDNDKYKAIKEHTGMSALEILKQQGYAE